MILHSEVQREIKSICLKEPETDEEFDITPEDDESIALAIALDEVNQFFRQMLDGVGLKPEVMKRYKEIDTTVRDALNDYLDSHGVEINVK